MKTPTAPQNIMNVVGFSLSGQEFGIDIRQVQEIIRPVQITRMPGSPGFVLGVINLRGRIIPVVDLKSRFGLPVVETTAGGTKIVIAEISGRLMGISVDHVSEVVKVPESQVAPPPDLATTVDSAYVFGVAKVKGRLLIILDLGKIFSEEEIQAIRLRQ